MGGNTSSQKELEQQLKEENEATIRRELQQREREEKEKKAEIKKRGDEKLAAEKKRAEKEMDDETKRKLDETTKAVEGYNEMKENRLKELTDLKARLAKKQEELLDNLKKSGTDRIEAETQDLRNEKKELIAQRELLAYEISRLDGVKKENLKERGKEIRRMEEEEAAQIDAHHRTMSEMKTKQLEEQVGMERERIRMAERMKEYQGRVGKEHEHLQAIGMANGREMMEKFTGETKFDDFRHSCRKIINHYNNFKRHFDNEETDLLTTRDDILYGDSVDDAPDLDAASGALSTLFADVTGFSVDGSNDQEKFTKLRNDFKTTVESLQTILNQISQKIHSYQKSPKDQETVQKAEGKQDGDGLGKPNRYDISNLYDDAKKLIKELNSKISEFNVCASNDFDDTLALQFQKLAVCGNKIANHQSIASEAKPVVKDAKKASEDKEEEDSDDEGHVEDADE